MNPFSLPEDLLLGSATAATQIEGGDIHNNWYFWSLKGKIANNESSIVAADHYNRYIEDIGLMKELNQEIYRMSIEWSRIEPEEGVWSKEGIEHYRDEFERLIEAGIMPLVTLHHFSCPQWVQEKGGWKNPQIIDWFLRFTEKVVLEYGDLISEYCTINEPNVFVNDTYMDGKYPPGSENDMMSYFAAAKNLILAHLKVYQLIHRKRELMGYQDTKVGIAHHLAYFDTQTRNPLTRLSQKLLDYSFHTIFLKGMVEGHLTFPLGFGYPEGKGVFCDFIGVNYYSRHLIYSSMNPASLFGEVGVEEDLPETRVNDLGWEIYPEGLGFLIRNLYDKYKLPIYITENGIADKKDSKRAKFIYDHLYQIKLLIDEGIDIQRYYYWSLMDNLEWNDGYSPRFGLIEINYKNLHRKIRDSARFYSAICREKGVSESMIKTFLEK